MGPVMTYDNLGVKDPYDPRRLMRNNTVLPSQSQPSGIPPAYCFHRSSMTSGTESSCERGDRALEVGDKRMDYMVHHQKQCLPPGKIAQSDVAIDMRGSPFFHHLSAVGGGEVVNRKTDQRIANEANMLQAKPPTFSSGIAAATAAVGAAHHRKVGTVQFGINRMY